MQISGFFLKVFIKYNGFSIGIKIVFTGRILFQLKSTVPKTILEK
jgi:hypothetical protein